MVFRELWSFEQKDWKEHSYGKIFLSSCNSTFCWDFTCFLHTKFYWSTKTEILSLYSAVLYAEKPEDIMQNIFVKTSSKFYHSKIVELFAVSIVRVTLKIAFSPTLLDISNSCTGPFMALNEHSVLLH